MQKNKGVLGMKNKKWSPVKEILFSYLAINKIMYWFNTITAMNQSDLEGIGEAILMRFLSQDLLIILSVVIFFFLDKLIHFKKSKYSNVLEHVIFYAAGYVILAIIAFVYILVVGLFFPIHIYSWSALVGYGTAGYIVVVIVFNIKYYLKSKEKETSE